LATDTRPPSELEIVGVVKNTLTEGLRRAPYPTVYVPYLQREPENASLEIRVAGSFSHVYQAVKQEIGAKLPDPTINIRGLTEQVDASLTQERAMAILADAFGLLGLVLATVGLYGLLAYNVARRTKEIGIRMALGAQRKRVIGMIVKGAVQLVVFGIALGLPAAWAASSLVKSMLFGLTPTDPATIAGAVAILATAALVAAYLPARRASRVDPMTALRHE
jgi:ABC-type antimicrobial peptide transport system permease subunit